MSDFILAAIQAEPVFFDVERSLEKASDLISDAGRMGADVAGFGEAWLGGYPFFCMAPPFHPQNAAAAAEYFAQAITVPGPETDVLCAVAKSAGTDVVIGVTEIDATTRGSVYATLLFIGSDGRLLGKHRKIKPSQCERNLWAQGTGDGLRVHARGKYRLSGLNCWEHNGFLPGYALARQGCSVHVAAWPGNDSPVPDPPVCASIRQTMLSRAFASMASTYVVAVSGVCTRANYPERYGGVLFYETPGSSTIIDPRGEVIAGPVEGETILTAEGSSELMLAAKALFDIGAKDGSPEVFKFDIVTNN
jgi:nitrilase